MPILLYVRASVRLQGSTVSTGFLLASFTESEPLISKDVIKLLLLRSKIVVWSGNQRLGRAEYKHRHFDVICKTALL